MNEDIIKIFPQHLRALFLTAIGEISGLQEIHIRVNQPVQIKCDSGEYFIQGNGALGRNHQGAKVFSMGDCEEVIRNICQYSIYAYADELKQGFITISGGHRIGVCGQVVLDNDNRIKTIKYLYFINIRVAHQVLGVSRKVLPYLYEEGRVLNTLIVSPPGCGKTTMLRDLIREISNGNQFGKGRVVGVVDERSEIAGCYLGKPQNDMGVRTDILDRCPKAIGMMQLLRSMAPDLIAVDELGSMEDSKAIQILLGCGCSILATIHGIDSEEIKEKAFMKPLFHLHAFDRMIYLRRENGIFQIEVIQEGNG